VNRREFITLLGGAGVAWPLAARAQQPDRVRRIGFWVGEVDSAIAQRRVAAFQQGLRELGWLEGRNIHIEYRWEILDADRIRSDAADLVALNLEVIITTGAPSLAALLQIARSIPIVFTFVTDPVAEQRDELAPIHSITSSAMASSPGGKTRPSAEVPPPFTR
jgi:putative tryptophan/tyrosine transport system substrate-binding protein